MEDMAEAENTEEVKEVMVVVVATADTVAVEL